MPRANDPILMEGIVIWSKSIEDAGKQGECCETGVTLLSVNGISVEKSIYFDAIHQVMWSTVLESVFGSFRKLAQKQKKSP